MQRTPVNPPNDWSAAFQMSQGELISGVQRTLYLSGQAAIKTDPQSELGVSIVHEGDMRAQLTYALGLIDDQLQRAGMARKNIVFVRFYSVDAAAFLENYDVYADWIAEAGIAPAQSDIGVAELAVPGLMIEVEVVAAD